MNVEPHSHKIRRRRRRRRRQCVTKWIRFVGRARAETRTRAQSCCIFNFALLSNNVIHLKICVRRCHACMSYTHRHTGDTLWISYIEEYWLAYIIGSARRVYAGTYTRHSTHSCKPMPIVCRYSVNEKEFFHICLTRTKGRVFFFFNWYWQIDEPNSISWSWCLVSSNDVQLISLHSVNLLDENNRSCQEETTHATMCVGFYCGQWYKDHFYEF